MIKAVRRAQNSGVNFFLYRIARSDISGGIRDVRTWSFAELIDAHIALDSIEEMQDIAQAEARRRAGSAGGL